MNSTDDCIVDMERQMSARARQDDEDLEALLGSVRRMKVVSKDIGDEVENQNEGILKDLATGVENVKHKLSTTRDKLEDLESRLSKKSRCGIILCLSATFCALVILIIAL